MSDSTAAPRPRPTDPRKPRKPSRTPPRAEGPRALDAAAYATDSARDLLLGTVRDVHGAIAGRVYGLTDLVGGRRGVSHRIHDGISGAVYGGIGAALDVSAAGLRRAHQKGYGARIDTTPGGRMYVAITNGLAGDRLVQEAPDLAITMSVRRHGRDVGTTQDELAAAFPGAGEDVVVFLHGLTENDESWFRPSRPRDPEGGRGSGSYGEQLAQDGWTAVHLRYNSGLPIADNGVALASLLGRLVAGWPSSVRRLALIGHSMGGLVIRSACAVRTDGVDEGSPWTDLVTDVVCLGTPHLGAPLERVVNHGVRALGWLPESAPFGRILEYRSVGILDLRQGLAPDIQNLPRARYRLVGATLTRSVRHPVAETVGDYLVPFSSAMGKPRRGPEMFPGAETLHLPCSDHFDLLNHDDVAWALRDWLNRSPAQDVPPEREQSA